MIDNSVKHMTVNIHSRLVPYLHARQLSLLIMFNFLLFLSRNFVGKKRGKIGGKKTKKLQKKMIFFRCDEEFPSLPAREGNGGGPESTRPRVGYTLHRNGPKAGEQFTPHGL